MLEDDFVFKYNSSEDPVIHDNKNFSQNIIYKTKSHTDDGFDLTVTVFYNDESVSFSFISEETVDKCVRRFLKDIHIKSGLSISTFTLYLNTKTGVISNPLEYTFSFVPEDGGEDTITMDSTLALSHYNLKEGVRLFDFASHKLATHRISKTRSRFYDRITFRFRRSHSFA